MPQMTIIFTCKVPTIGDWRLAMTNASDFRVTHKVQSPKKQKTKQKLNIRRRVAMAQSAIN